jgi:hypothetical protein
MTKRFGPVNDAGVVVIEKEAERAIQASQLGSTGYAGIMERGPVGELIVAASLRDLLAKTGGYIPESLLPDANQDFWRHSEGAGVQLLCRVTDGNEVKAALTSYDRSAVRNAVVQWDGKNGGGWAGRQSERVMDLDAVPADITAETTVKLPDAYVVPADRWKGGTVRFSETGISYEIVSHTVGDGITGAVVTVKADSLMLTDFAAGSDVEIFLRKDQTDGFGRERKLAVLIKDGQVNPTTEWAAEVYLNGDIVISWANLSMDPGASNYFAKVINEDLGNHYVAVTDLWSPNSVVAANRPANDYGVIPTSGVTSKVLTLAKVAVDLSQANASTVGTFVFGADVVPDTYTLTRGAVDWSVTSVKQALHTFPSVADAATLALENALSIEFTLGGTPAQNDVITIHVLVLRADDAIGGFVYPDVDNAPNTRFRISDNDEETVTIASGDLTVDGADGDNYRLEYQQELEDGYDGIAAVTEQDFIDCFDIPTSPFNDAAGQGYGLIKFGCPGIEKVAGISTPETVQQAGVAYAESKNHQFRYEIDSTVTDEATARDYVNNTLGRNDHAKVIFPSYCDVADRVKTGLLKEVPLTGMVHGREAREARNFLGYHKVAAGITVNLPDVRSIPTGDRVLNGEILNPAGLQRVERKNGRFVIWGARVPSVDSAFRFSQHRELLSYYEHVLIESFDFVIFAINDPLAQPGLIAALKSFFLPEWRKRALRGDSLDEAATIKIDDENNTDATRAAGDMNAEVTLQLADTIERFIITIGKRGVFESSAAA